MLKNSDISDELLLSQDLTFDEEILNEHKNRCARLIQRWWRQAISNRLLRETE
jgi:hypothetical protein